MVKEWFAALKYMIPSELEFYLEKKAADGYMLQEIGPMGLFYFEFVEEKGQKCKYVVDVTALPKAIYMETVLAKGWEYMGKTGNCYVWRKKYTEQRPEDFADLEARKKHCVRLGITFLVIALLFLGTMAALIWGVYFERSKGIHMHTAVYITEAVINLPFFLFFGYLARKLLSYKKEVRMKMQKEEDKPVLDFVKTEN